MSHTYWEEKGIFWPDTENKKDHDHALGRIDASDAALELLPEEPEFCVQAGGWVGAWPLYLANHFKTVLTYEPVPYLYECLVANIKEWPSIIARNIALGAADGGLQLDVALSGCTSAALPMDPKSQSRFVERINVPMASLDGELMNQPRVDALFLDVERWETAVLDGAKQIIKKHRPVITVEVLKGEGDKMLGWMSRHGYALRNRVHNDWIFTKA